MAANKGRPSGRSYCLRSSENNSKVPKAATGADADKKAEEKSS
jgi:hypothetical protein